MKNGTRRSRAREINRLLAETKAKQLVAAGWSSIETIPRDRPVEIHSVTGIECRVKVRGGALVHNGMIDCFRLIGTKWKGDIKAVAWREA